MIIYNELLNTYFRFNSEGKPDIIEKKSVWDHCEEVQSVELKNTLISEEMLENYFLEIRGIAELFTTNKSNDKTGELLKDYLNNFDRK
ncbi:MAG: hypothetical protein IPJ13_22645 [Saprospiraceae bacterium]|nr:hypothetical protein [Saprospiraceae bacterium]